MLSHARLRSCKPTPPYGLRRMGGNVNRRGQAAKLQMIWEEERRKQRDAKPKSWAGNDLKKLVRICPAVAHPALPAAPEGRGKCKKTSVFSLYLQQCFQGTSFLTSSCNIPGSHIETKPVDPDSCSPPGFGLQEPPGRTPQKPRNVLRLNLSNQLMRLNPG